MFSFFGSRKNQETALGIDIGTTSVKAAEISRIGKHQFALTNYAILEITGHLDHFNNALQTSTLRPLVRDLTAYLNLIKEKAQFKNRVAIFSIPSFSVFTTLLDLPSGSDSGKNIANYAQNYLPIPIEEVTLDWTPLGSFKKSDGATVNRIFVTGVPHEKINLYQEICKNSGYIFGGFETESASIARVLTTGIKTSQLIIDIGGGSTTITVAKNGIPLFAGQADFSGASLTQALATALNINPNRADSLKKTVPIIGAGGNHELSTVLTPIVDVILKEAERTRENFEKNFSEKIQSVLLTGSASAMPGLDQYIRSKLNIPVNLANPLTVISYPPELSAFSKELGDSLAVAIGLALKKLIKQ